MGLNDDERRRLKLQAVYEDMEMITRDPLAASVLTCYEMAVEDFSDLGEVLSGAIRQALFGDHGDERAATLQSVAEGLVDGITASI